MTGMYPPPPLNGSAHTWHHSREVLTDLIKKGTEPMGNMPGWGDKLNDSDISDIVDWVVSIWPKDIYQLWIDRYKMAK